MARRKRSSPAVDHAETRAAALESIDPALDLGSGLTLAAYKASITTTNTQLAAYNTRLSELDGVLNALKAAERDLGELSSRMLAGVAVKFGKNSSEYEKAGGKRTDERKSPVRRVAAPLKTAAA